MAEFESLIAAILMVEAWIEVNQCQARKDGSQDRGQKREI
jgi:hypothetical protein